MSALPHPQAACPRCGWSRQASQNNVGQLEQGTTLKNPSSGREYLIGKTVGQGGFGIVYTAWDVAGDRKVAVKEYFPRQFVARDRSNTVVLTSNSQNDKDFFDKQKRRFRQEAEKMQIFADSPNVVTVLDFFDANNTSYIVMEFIEGQTFMQVLDGPMLPEHRLSLQTVLSNFQNVVDILERIHSTPWTDDDGKIHQGIIHRDISPENIMYASDGTVKLLDFGAARVSNPGDHLTGVLKPGYAPYEQYLTDSSAKQGSWTDVYGLAATIYRAITGTVPPDSIARSNSDNLVPPSAFGIQITPAQEQVLLKGLAIDYRNRYQSVSQFYNDLVNGGAVNVNGGGVVNVGSTVNVGGGGQIVNKSVPMLTVSSFNKNGNTYIATINYNGDGMLSSSVGTVNGNILSVVSADGFFNGAVMASEGERFFAASVTFEHKESSKSKAPWAAAAILLVAAVFSFGKMHSNQSELTALQNQISTERQQMEKYQSFAADYGYASSSYYADKAIVFLGKNSEAKLPIYCDLLKGTNSKAFWHLLDGEGNGLINVKWENKFDAETHKANIIINSADKVGFATIHFTNEVNSDSFDVLVVVQ